METAEANVDIEWPERWPQPATLNSHTEDCFSGELPRPPHTRAHTHTLHEEQPSVLLKTTVFVFVMGV